jgi:DHA3 family tetracycline resistance protein-like MFS transporter
MALFRSLKHRAFLWLWLGQTISRVGDFMYEIALAWWVLQKTGSATAMGMVLVFAITPAVIFYLIGGVAVDRFSRVGLILASDLARAGVVLLVSLLASLDRLALGGVLVASLFFGIVDAFFQPAFIALIPQVVPSDDLSSANSLASISTNLGRVLGPALGASVVALIGASVAFAIDGLSFLISAAFLVPLLSAHIPRVRAAAASSVLGELRDGFRTVLASQWLWISIVIFALTNIALAGLYNVAMVFLVNNDLHAGVETLGLLYAMFPLGYLVGGVFLGRYHTIRRRGPLMYGAGIVAALALGVFGLLPPLWVLSAAALLNGAALEIGHLTWTNTLQAAVPNDRLGRVASIDNMGSFALLPVGFMLAGWATEAFGAPHVFVVGGGLTAGAYGLALLIPAIRRLD